MALALDPSVPIARGLRAVARGQLGEAIERIDVIVGALDGEPGEPDGPDVEREIHETRKRCKEVRAIARLVESAEGREAQRVDRLVRQAARRLSASRDAAVLARTLDGVAAGATSADSAVVRSVAAHVDGADGRCPELDALREAQDELRRARRRIKRWRLDDGDEVVRRGLASTIRRARRRWSDAVDLDPGPMHAWRTVNKRWWYQARLLEAAAPDELAPMISRLDAVGERLGEVHDLDVLLERLESVRSGVDDIDGLDRVVELTEARRAELAAAAMRRAGPLFVEGPGHAARRLIGYWRLAVATGVEPDGIDSEGAGSAADDASSAGGGIERERKYLVDTPPASPAAAVHLRQGYLAVDGSTSVRIRSVEGGSATLTVKVGAGTTRHELEWPISAETFDELWPLTEGRRVDKERFVRSLDGHSVEVDVFHDRLDGLVVAEVEFDDDASMAAFEPPPWFGREVSDDVRYTNARLAIDGLPDG